MRPHRVLRQMAGIEPTAYDRAMARLTRRAQFVNRLHLQELQLLEMMQRRQRGDEGTPPMPFAKMREDLAKMTEEHNVGKPHDVDN
jgi:hypothetical protein